MGATETATTQAKPRQSSYRREQIAFPVMRWLLDKPRLADAFLGRMRWGNAFSDERLRDPYADADEMLDDGYVTFHKSFGQWMVLGYEEGRTVLQHPAFGVGERVPMLQAISPYNKLEPETIGTMLGWMSFLDPPDHTRLRGMVSRWFTPRRISELRPRVQELTDDLIASMVAGVSGDNRQVEIVQAFSEVLPANVIGHIMGMAPEHWPELRRIGVAGSAVLDPIRGFDPAVIDAQFQRLKELVLESAARRRAEPADDLMTVLVQATDDGDRLTEDELVSMVGFILLAGHDTTTNAIGTNLYNLARFPDERAKLQNNPDLVENAVEELFRYDTPVPVIGRNALEDFEVGGRTIKKGDLVIVSLGMANRDLRRFADADQLKLDRPDPRPLTFGNGIHHCLGAALARMELQVATPALLDALGDYTVDPDAVEWRPLITLRGPSRLPVTVG